MRRKAVDAVAKLLYAASEARGTFYGTDTPESVRAFYRRLARAVLTTCCMDPARSEGSEDRAVVCMTCGGAYRG